MHNEFKIIVITEEAYERSLSETMGSKIKFASLVSTSS
jgi:hypothetical protein